MSHDNEMVYNYCDETVVLDHGKVMYHGSTIDLFNDEKKIDAYASVLRSFAEIQ